MQIHSLIPQVTTRLPSADTADGPDAMFEQMIALMSGGPAQEAKPMGRATEGAQGQPAPDVGANPQVSTTERQATEDAIWPGTTAAAPIVTSSLPDIPSQGFVSSAKTPPALPMPGATPPRDDTLALRSTLVPGTQGDGVVTTDQTPPIGAFGDGKGAENSDVLQMTAGAFFAPLQEGGAKPKATESPLNAAPDAAPDSKFPVGETSATSGKALIAPADLPVAKTTSALTSQISQATPAMVAVRDPVIKPEPTNAAPVDAPTVPFAVMSNAENLANDGVRIAGSTVVSDMGNTDGARQPGEASFISAFRLHSAVVPVLPVPDAPVLPAAVLPVPLEGKPALVASLPGEGHSHLASKAPPTGPLIIPAADQEAASQRQVFADPQAQPPRQGALAAALPDAAPPRDATGFPAQGGPVSFSPAEAMPRADDARLPSKVAADVILPDQPTGQIRIKTVNPHDLATGRGTDDRQMTAVPRSADLQTATLPSSAILPPETVSPARRTAHTGAASIALSPTAFVQPPVTDTPLQPVPVTEVEQITPPLPRPMGMAEGQKADMPIPVPRPGDGWQMAVDLSKQMPRTDRYADLARITPASEPARAPIPAKTAEQPILAPSTTPSLRPVAPNDHRLTESVLSDKGALAVGQSPAASVQGPTVVAASAASPPPMPPAQQLSQAMTAALHEGKTGQIDLTLRPHELGNIRFEMTTVGERIHIIISAERPEAMDLIRRNADQLLADMRQSGFGQTSLGFGGWAQREQSAQGAARHGTDPTDTGANDSFSIPATPLQKKVADGRLDLRL